MYKQVVKVAHVRAWALTISVENEPKAAAGVTVSNRIHRDQSA
jgi:hypothetical protein